jgi:hypothetical protein
MQLTAVEAVTCTNKGTMCTAKARGRYSTRATVALIERASRKQSICLQTLKVGANDRSAQVFGDFSSGPFSNDWVFFHFQFSPACIVCIL